MKTLKFKSLLVLCAAAVSFASCTKDDETEDEIILPTEVTADGEWAESDIVSGEKWYKINCDAGSTKATLEWAEASHKGEDRDYSADIAVSAYLLDGLTAYFEGEDIGFKDLGQTFELQNSEASFLVKVELGPTEAPGTFAIRAKSVMDIEVVYSDLTPSSEWMDSTIKNDEVIGFKVKCTPETKYKIMWAELGSPEEGYTADINGSVLNKDADTFYTVAENGSGFFQDKKKSYSNDSKIIISNADENNFKIHLTGVTKGSFAIKVEEVTE